MRVLIVEDELIAAENLKEFLEEEAHEVLAVTDRGSEAIELARQLRPDAVLMDIMLKDGLSGSEAALRIRQICDTRIVFITAYALDEMLDYAMQADAEAYLVKPYNKEQIKTTMRLVQRKGKQTPKLERIALFGGYAFDPADEQLYNGSVPIKLGPKARLLLSLLCKSAGSSVSHAQICGQLWSEEVDDGVLRALIYRIRVALGVDLIENVRDIGYRVVLAEERS